MYVNIQDEFAFRFLGKKKLMNLVTLGGSKSHFNALLVE